MRSTGEYAGDIYSDASIIRSMFICHLSEGTLLECCRHGPVMSVDSILTHRGGMNVVKQYLIHKKKKKSLPTL